MEEQDILRCLSALSQAARLRAFRALVGAGPAGMTPGQLAEVLAVPSPTLSFHLKELAHAQLVSQTREGRHILYRARFDRMNALLAYLTDHCCAGQPCEVVPATASCSC